MDRREIAETLGELERKLRELERVLGGVAQSELDTSVPGNAESVAAPAPTVAATPPVAAAPAPSVPGRLVDESVEQGATPPPAAAPPAPIAASVPAVPLPATSALPGRRPPRDAERSTNTAELLRFRERLERTAHELTHDYDELLGRITYAAVPAPTGPAISFARGAPSLDIVDVDGLRDAAVRAFDSDPAGTTAYGTSIGYPRLRAWIADRHGVEPERVLVTNGSMQADAFLFEHVVRPGDDVIVERPTYDRTLLSLRERGANVRPIELQPDGIDTQALAGALASGAVRPTLAHIIPNFQNPAGYTLSLAKREALLELAARHDFLVFEDDPYVALRFSGESMPTMLSIDPERVVYASSFSKTVCPGIRVGYLVGPTDLIAAIGRIATNTYISPNMVAQSIVYEFCASGAIERSIETVRTALAKRALTLSEALRRELPEAEFVQPDGGYFMWVTLPPGTDVAALFKAAADLGVAFVKGTDFLLDGGENTLRLAYSGVTPEQIDEGVARLADAYRSLT
ncbi:MAG TPA: PLP-dependent aminotransferase family protein [Solirubrobacteraceae bacterium]|nr:PLP-dependent aminotransferase family protein [Solirubrobacteraceae bacterium]